MSEIKQLNRLCTQIRRDILMVHSANSVHTVWALGCVEYFVAMYWKVLRHNPNLFCMKGEDLLFLSNGHIYPVYYSALARRGFFSIRELNRKLNTPASCTKGIRIGQGMSVAIGAALAKKLNQDHCLIYSFHGEGELNEGKIWEAAIYAGSRGIDNYIATVDCNGQQIDGRTVGNTKEKFTYFGWDVFEELQANDISCVINSLEIAKKRTCKGKPILIVLYTMGKGVWLSRAGA